MDPYLSMVEIIDPHKNKEKWENWKSYGMKLEGISKDNCDLIRRYLMDMERGKNINGSNKGCRSPIRLNVLRIRLPQIAKFFELEYKVNLAKITRDMATEFGFKLKNGEFKRVDGKPYEHKVDFIKDIKAFWHWYMRAQSRLHYDTRGKEGELLTDVTEDLLRDSEKPPQFVYFTIEELQKMIDVAKFKYKVLMMFLFDSIIRAPKELANVRVCDLEEIKGEIYQLDIREETSKTFGRKIKLILSSKMVKKYIEKEGLKGDDYLFKIAPYRVNEYLKELGRKVIGKTPTMYDFRHSGACYWTTRYQQETALRYRGGWKDSLRLDYYTQFLGMKDTITKEDLDDADTRTELQKRVEDIEKERALLLDQIQNLTKEKNREFEKFSEKISKLEKVYEFLEDKKINQDAKERMKIKLDETISEAKISQEIVEMMAGQER